MHETGKSKQRDRDVEPRRRLQQKDPSERNHRCRNKEFSAVDRRLADMRGHTDRHGRHVADDEPLAPFLGGRQAADGDHGGEVVKPDDRMAETGEQPVRERHRHLAAHDMMGERGLDLQSQRDDDGEPERFRRSFYAPEFLETSGQH